MPRHSINPPRYVVMDASGYLVKEINREGGKVQIIWTNDIRFAKHWQSMSEADNDTKGVQAIVLLSWRDE